MGCGENYTSNDDELLSEFPSVSSTSPSDSDILDSSPSVISVTFSEEMDTIGTNTLDSLCNGTIMVSLDNFNTCVQMSSAPTASNSNKTYSVTPSSSLSSNKTYKIKIKGAYTKSLTLKSLRIDYVMKNGFTIK